MHQGTNNYLPNSTLSLPFLLGREKQREDEVETKREKRKKGTG
jgi:hypothetical protein